MSTMRLQPALKCYLISGIKGLAVFFAVIIAVMVAIPVFIAVLLDGVAEITFFGLGMGSMIMFFVFGIGAVRENIKLFLQNGCGRPTLFWADLSASLVMALAMAVACELLVQLFNSTSINTTFSISEMLFSLNTSADLPTAQSSLLSFCSLLLAWRGGMFASLVYYRLNKLGQVIISVLVPTLLLFGLPFSVNAGRIDPTLFERAFHWLIASPYNAMLAMLIAALLFSLGSWLLLRKAQVKE